MKRSGKVVKESNHSADHENVKFVSDLGDHCVLAGAQVSLVAQPCGEMLRHSDANSRHQSLTYLATPSYRTLHPTTNIITITNEIRTNCSNKRRIPHSMSAPARLRQYLYSNIMGPTFGTAPTTEDEEPSTSRVAMHQPGEFEPFLEDVLEAKKDLFRGLKIPMELVDAILDYAEYWPHTTTVRRGGEMSVMTGRERPEDEFVVSLFLN